MDYTTGEVGIVSIFNNYLSEGQYLEAENFIEQEMKKKRDSVLLKYSYSRYLKEQKRQPENAIQVLESILELSNNHPTILRLLIACYISLDIPNYEKAGVYVREIENTPTDDDSQKLEIAEFYVRWSISIKMNREIYPDPINEMLRQQRYKELADKALFWLDQIEDKHHHICYLSAQSYFNKWDYVRASDMIEKAISLCGRDSHCLSSYRYLRDLILRQQEKYSGRRPPYK